MVVARLILLRWKCCMKPERKEKFFKIELTDFTSSCLNE